MTLKNNRTPLLCYIKLCASFQSHRWIQTGVTVPKSSIRVKIGDFLSCVTLKIDGWPWKTIEHPFLCCFKLRGSFHSNQWIQSKVTVRKRSIRVKISDFLSRKLEILRMTLKNNRAPLLCCFKLYASFHSHQWIQTKVTVRKRSIGLKIGDLLSVVTFKFDGWPCKTIGHLFYVASSFVHHFIAITEFKLKLQSGNVQFWSKSAIFFVWCDLQIWRMTL